MSDQLLTLAELSETLQVSPDIIYKWEMSIPVIRPRLSDGGRRYDSWEVEVLKQAKGFFIGYQHDLERTRVALERWVSRHPRPEPPALSPDEDFFGPLPSASTLTASLEPASPPPPAPLTPARAQGAQGAQGGRAPMTPSATPRSTHSSATPPSPSPTASASPTATAPAATATAPAATATARRAPAPAPRAVGAVVQPQARALPATPSTSSQGLTSARAHLMSLNVGVGDDDAQVWKAHFQQAQLELRRAHEEIERMRETMTQQHAAIKQIQGDFHALKELVRKEIYDLRDLVVDNG